MKGMADFVPRVDKAFGAGTSEPGLHIKLEVTPNRGKYEPGKDQPKFDDHRGPRCYDWVKGQFPQYAPDGPFRDGATAPPEARGAQQTANDPNSKSRGGSAPNTVSPMSSGGLGVVNSPAERDFVSGLLAPSMGRQPGQVPQWSSLLVGPVLRGADVSY